MKVDAAALLPAVVDGIKKGKADLDDPATTLTLIKLSAAVGVKGTLNADGSLKSIGLTCAVCHSTVDDSFAPGIGCRLDGLANRDLNSGAIISLLRGLNDAVIAAPREATLTEPPSRRSRATAVVYGTDDEGSRQSRPEENLSARRVADVRFIDEPEHLARVSVCRCPERYGLLRRLEGAQYIRNAAGRRCDLGRVSSSRQDINPAPSPVHCRAINC
jgi:hypothetical protein